MGHGYSSLTERNVGAAGSDISELPEFSYDKPLGTGRFLKTIRARHKKGTAVVKIFVKPGGGGYSLKRYFKQIEREKEALAGVLNAFPYQKIIETDRAGYLIRQNLYSSLYDRVSTRPFLEEIEKKWIAFQLLCGLRDCHFRGVHHGDIKSENVMISSWNWVHLADFASFKPTYLPEYDPADFAFFFDTSGKRTCYVAPERFVDSEQGQDGLTDQMDVFSLGCVIAELFLEGTPLFSLSQLFKYRKGEFDPTAAYLHKIEDPEIRSLIQHMVQLNPTDRLSAEEYLNKWRGKAFPEYYYSFLHGYISSIIDPSSRPPVPKKKKSQSEGDYRINAIYSDFDKISSCLCYTQTEGTEKVRNASYKNILPVYLDIPNYQRGSLAVCRRPGAPDDGTLIFLSFVAASMRATSRTSARLKACDLLLAFAERISDEAKLDRCLPYLIALLTDEAPMVQMAAIRTITQLMELVEVVSPVNAYVFPEYILPKLKLFTIHKNPSVRAMLASCLASLADSASRFLNLAQDLRGQGVLPTADPETEVGTAPESTYQALFDIARSDLATIFQEYATVFLTDPDSSVRRAILTSVTRLCVFFGRQKANDVILSHLNTYLNDKDWMLRSAFFETIIGVAAFLGGTSLEEYIMPLMVQALADPEELVVEKVVRSLASMAGIGLFQRSKTWELIDIVARFAMHPNLWIRQASTSFIASAAKWLSPADVHCIVFPTVKLYLRSDVIEVTQSSLLEYLMSPLPRPVFDQAVAWATKPGRANFWRIAQEQRVFAFGASEEYIPRSNSRDKQAKVLQRLPLNDEDETWFTKLRQKGMTKEDEWKLVILREYVWKMANSKSRLSDADDPALSLLNNIISLKELGITPQTVFFDFSKVSQSELEIVQQKSRAGGRPYSVAEALLDASRSIDDHGRRSIHERRSRRVSNGTVRPRVYCAQIQEGVSEMPRTSDPSSSAPAPALALNGSSTEASTLSGSPDDTHLVTVGGGHSLAHALQHRSSMVSLLNRGKDKAAPETGTVSATAFGEVENPFDSSHPGSYASSLQGDPTRDRGWESEHRITHSRAQNYGQFHNLMWQALDLQDSDGQDPHVLKLLDNLFEENFPIEMLEFGPAIVAHSKRMPIKRSNGKASGQIWRPDGNLVAHYGEHAAAVNRVVVAPDHAFFVTGSDDGTVKVWDTGRLEKNVAGHHCFVCGDANGGVYIVRVDYSSTGTSVKYGKLRVVKQWQLPREDEWVVWMEHYKQDTKSILLMATNKSAIIALELRAMKEIWRLTIPLHHGTPTTFCTDRRRIWLVVGTTHGVVDMFDLRFLIRVKAWGLPGMTSIHRIQLHPSKGRGKWVCIAGGCGQGEITVWDVEKTMCREVYRAGINTGKEGSGKGYEAWRIDELGPEGVLSRFAGMGYPLLEPNAQGGVDRGVRAIAVAADIGEERGGEGSAAGGAGGATAAVGGARGASGGGSTGSSTGGMGFMISAGGDRKIRYWNLGHVESSCVVSGLEIDEPKPTFTQTQLTTTLTFNAEKPGGIGGGNIGKTRRGSRSSAVVGSGSGVPGSPGGGTGVAARPPRSTVISMQQQQLLKSHLDAVLDVAILEVPYGMCVSVDRSGNVLVFQ
ncbi:hypothetical protein BGX38DRAFT_1274971 [Terfezia claveryi]|nr:hypothetical protein BGX38DRAFT_1274971 [Terfezia claveryi]